MKQKSLLFLLELFFSMCVHAQSIPALRKQAADAVFREKLYVRTDRDSYLAGEQLWWKLYYVDDHAHHRATLSKVVYVEVLNDRNIPVLQASAALTDRGSNGSFLLPASIVSGSYTLRAYTNWMKNFGEACFFSRPVSIINVLNGGETATKPGNLAPDTSAPINNSLTIGLHSDAESYPTRNEVKLRVHANSNTAGLSVSVYRIDAPYHPSGEIYRCFSPAESSDLKDSLPILYPPEFDGHILTGRIKTSAGQPLVNAATYLGIPAAGRQFYAGETDSLGRFSFDVRDYFGPGKVYIQTPDSELVDGRISLDDPFFKSAPRDKTGNTVRMPDTVSDAVGRAAIDMQVQNIYWSAHLGKSMAMVTDTLPFFGRHSVNYNLDNYVRFPTVEEVLREYVLEVVVRRINRKLELSVLDVEHNVLLPLKPLILLDGVAVSPEKILSYDPLKIQKLHVVTSNYNFGPFIYGGVISFNTYRNDAADLEPEHGTLVADYDGLQPTPVFFSPEYKTAEEKNSRLPDFRRLLYWSPDVVTDNEGNANLSFYTSDLPGTYVIVAEGMDANGRVGSSTHSIQVVK